AADRLQRHFGGEIGPAGERGEVHGRADFAVLGQVAPGLAHDPDRGVRHGLAPAGGEEGGCAGRCGVHLGPSGVLYEPWAALRLSCAPLRMRSAPRLSSWTAASSPTEAASRAGPLTSALTKSVPSRLQAAACSRTWPSLTVARPP